MFVSKAKLMMAVLVVALVVPATAFAAHSWPDVPDDKFYTESVAWAKANGMTTGCDGGTNFCPERGVTRGENITFAKRYDDIVVQPAIGTLTAAAATAQAAAADNASDIEFGRENWIENLNPAIARHDFGDQTTTFEINETTVVASGDGDIVFPIDKPFLANGTSWEVFTVSACFELSGGAVVDAVNLWNKTAAAPQVSYSDETDQAASTCVPLFPPKGFSSGHLSLEVELKAGGTAEIYSLLVWWTHPDNMS